ncbi:hypothetical protein BpHYR1_032616 [Brachionus plicatilis]|uniref:Uncharacterized protein n=1 Tax=Brachionus plicatilis TaxID=10195 RepID=A0A3M7R8C2_BRAPC|nr:hypothetical protein BpHYR1_032616 [Brachionus plicatilis]
MQFIQQDAFCNSFFFLFKRRLKRGSFAGQIEVHDQFLFHHFYDDFNQLSFDHLIMIMNFKLLLCRSVYCELQINIHFKIIRDKIL